MQQMLDVLALLSLLLIAVVMRSLRREHIRVEHSVSWLAAGIAVLILSRSHTLLNRLAGYFGFQNEAGPILMVILVVFLGVFYRFSRAVSGLKDMNITLTQRVAILEYQLREQNEKQQAQS